jgi:pimeloyl-ACP methyl ester carboxylesterase
MRAALFLVLVAAVGCSKPRHTEARMPLAPCELTGPGQVTLARCGTLDVFEDREAKSGRKISIRVAVVPAADREGAADPLFIIVGGPGQAAIQTYPLLGRAFARVHERRDIVLVDQRGTGESHRLDCPDFDDDADDPEAVERLGRECLASLDGDVRRYGTESAVADLDEVRDALGYEQIDIYGGSYGTRVGLVYARRHRDHLRALVLDGLAPPTFVLGATMARDAQQSFDAISAQCARAPDCQRAFGDLRTKLRELMVRFAGPVTVSATDPVSGAPKSVTLTQKKVASTILMLSYGRETMTLLPFLVHDAWATRDYARLASLSLQARTMVAVASGMHLAVTCSEDAPFLNPNEGAPGTYLGDGIPQTYLHACKAWPRVVPDRVTITSDVPALLLSGELDPVTPPAHADKVALARAKHVIVPSEGHGTVMRGCLPRLVADFLERGSADGLDTSCVSQSHDIRFFTSAAGPQP